MKQETIYICGICGNRSFNADEIRQCEATPVEQAPFKVGDLVRHKEWKTRPSFLDKLRGKKPAPLTGEILGIYPLMIINSHRSLILVAWDTRHRNCFGFNALATDIEKI